MREGQVSGSNLEVSTGHDRHIAGATNRPCDIARTRPIRPIQISALGHGRPKPDHGTSGRTTALVSLRRASGNAQGQSHDHDRGADGDGEKAATAGALIVTESCLLWQSWAGARVDGCMPRLVGGSGWRVLDERDDHRGSRLHPSPSTSALDRCDPVSGTAQCDLGSLHCAARACAFHTECGFHSTCASCRPF